MTATVYLDLDTIRFFIDDTWHFPDRLTRIPQTGEAVRMLCGTVAAAHYDDRTARVGPTRVCPECDWDYRGQHGIPRYAPRPRSPG